MDKKTIHVLVNGEARTLTVAPNDLLINVLRQDLELTGTKYACGIGECGACTVHVNGRPVLSCLTLAATVDGCAITTIEGIGGPDGSLDPLQEAFLDEGAYQCGFCTPGFIMSSKALLNENPAPTEGEIQEYLRGNLCRCTGYQNIIKAVQAAAARLQEEQAAGESRTT